ncbi:MAG: helix-turn-helix domain-containing protein [Pseudomonadota bacterium]
MESNSIRQALLSLQSPAVVPDHFAEITGLSKDTVRGMLNKGQLRTVKVGRRRMVNMLHVWLLCLKDIDLNELDAFVFEGEEEP